ncbi:MAG: MBL fold metallo-hydrolase [Spirochaetota bacterium]
MKIFTLIENTVFQAGLFAEHGLCLLIEADKKILFDTGQSPKFIENAKFLGIDIENIDYLVVSHGHYDHAGGIEAFCKINKKAQIFIGEGFFTPKFKDKSKFIGIKDLIYKNDNLKSRFNFVNKITNICTNFYILPKIKIENNWDTHFEGMYIADNNIKSINNINNIKDKSEIKNFTNNKDKNNNIDNIERYQIDQFEDEIALIIEKDDKINIISGCSHRGITNVIQMALNLFNRQSNLVLGGFHISNLDDYNMQRFIEKLSHFPIDKIGCCHCTGIEKFAKLKNVFGEKVFYNSTGNIIEI